MLVDAPKRPPTSMNVHLKKQRGLRKARYPYWGARLRMATARRRGIEANGRFTAGFCIRDIRLEASFGGDCARRAIPIGGGFKANGRFTAGFCIRANLLKRASAVAPKCRTPQLRGAFALAERGGFEPPVQFNPYGSLANYWFKPLTHLSNSGGKYSRPIQFCDPGWIRTNDHQLRRQVLYPAELRDHCCGRK